MVVDLLSTTWFTFIILPFADSLCNTDIYHYIIHYDATQNYYYYFKNLILCSAMDPFKILQPNCRLFHLLPVLLPNVLLYHFTCFVHLLCK